MKICIPCKIEMRCARTGKDAVWHKEHCYRGDEFICPKCGTAILVCNPVPYDKLNAYLQEDCIRMTDEQYPEEK